MSTYLVASIAGKVTEKLRKTQNMMMFFWENPVFGLKRGPKKRCRPAVRPDETFF
jgi:hypothetical protein